MDSQFDKEELHVLAGISENALANKMALICLTVLDSILSVAYLAEALKGSRPWGYVLLVIVLAIVPFVIGWVLFKSDNDHFAIKHVVIIGFAILYALVLFTAANDLVFTYAFPMLIVVTLYLDKKIAVIAGSGVVILNIIDVVRKALAGLATAERVPMFEIQILVSLLIVIYIVLTISTSLKYQEISGARLTLEKEKTAEVLNTVLSISGSMTDDIGRVVGQMNELSGSVESTLDAMSDVQSGAAETANSVQDQLQQTEEIQNYAAAVENASDVIKTNIAATTSAVEAGKRCMEEMTNLSATAINTSNQVSYVLNEFKETTDKMNQITDLINSVADQTGLLALNASIEAARAGESGRGFAVVATEISNLAGQTSGATENIVALISDINKQLGNMIISVNEMIQDNNMQAEAAKRTEDTFNTIVYNIDEIRIQSDVLSRSVEELANANRVIVDSVTTISAISEEVSAHSNDTYESSQRNQDIVKMVESIVGSLNDNARILSETSIDK